MKKKIDWQGVSWVIFHGIAWRRDIKDAIVALYKRTFPGLWERQDRAQYYRDMAQVDRSAPDVKEQTVAQAIKSEHGRKIIAQAMVSPIRKNVNYYE